MSYEMRRWNEAGNGPGQWYEECVRWSNLWAILGLGVVLGLILAGVLR